MAKQTYTTGQVLTAAQMTTLQTNDFNQTVSAKTASYTLVAADAGTRITMSNASATTITVNTAIFTAGDTLQITNIGAGICTVTAGTATVSTAGVLTLAQNASGTLYFTSTGVSIFQGSVATAAGGKVLQVVQGNLTGYTTTTSTTLQDPGLSVSITPSLASSKVLILTGINNIAKNSGNAATALRLVLLRGSTSIMSGGDRIAFNNTSVYSNVGSATLNFLDTPATTSATTYKVQFASTVSTQLVAINDYDSLNTGVSTIIAIEIGA